MRVGALLLVCLTLVLPVCAFQDDDSESLDSEDARAAYFNLNYEQNGGAHVELFLTQQPSSWDGIRQALSQVLHCPGSYLQHPDAQSTISRSRALGNLSSYERERWIKAVESQSLLKLQGECPAETQRKGLAFDASIDTTDLVSALRAQGISQLGIAIVVPDSPYVAFTGDAEKPRKYAPSLMGKVARQSTYVQLSLDGKTVAPKLGVAFGWSRALIARTLIRTVVFLLLPFCLLLRMRVVALKSFKGDPTTAWFAYVKTLSWCTNGGMLLWYLTNLGARKDLERLLNFVFTGRDLSVAVNVATYFLPAAFIYISCIAISHRVFVEVKKAQITWTQFLAEHSITLARIIVPIALCSVAIPFLSQPRIVFTLIFSGFASLILFGRLRLRITKNFPRIVLAGELRDRVFGFAKELNVKLQQVIILPAQRMQIANAFASSANTVIFTDFLLERMSKREVDAIAGHELTHLKRSHPAKLQMAMLGAIFAPVLAGIFGGLLALPLALLYHLGIKPSPAIVMNFYSALAAVSDWGIDGAIIICLAFACVYALSRRFERQADAGAVAVTKDPEAMITALLKLNSLNLMPLSWGKGTGASLTHPSTLKRIQRIAESAALSDARLQQLIAEYSVEKLSHVELSRVAEQHKVGDHYGAQDSESTVSHKVVTRSQNLLFVLIAMMVLPPALIELAVERLHLAGRLYFDVLGVGVVLITVLYFLAMKMLPLHSLGRQKEARLKEIETGGINARVLDTCMVGFAPGAAPRIYLGKYNFDVGAMLLSKDRLVFLGEQLKFSLTRKQVLSIQMGPGAPSWWPQQRIYIRWQDDPSGKDGVFSFSPQEPCSLHQLNSHVREIYSKLLTWRLRGQPQSLPTELEALPVPQIGEVTCLKPRELLRFKIQFSVLALAGIAIWGVSSILGIGSVYLWLTVLVLRIFETLPYLFYREPKQEMTTLPAIAKPATATS